MSRRREREWLDLVASPLAAPLTGWPDEQVGLLLNETFAAPACSFNARVGVGPVVLHQWPRRRLRPPRRRPAGPTDRAAGYAP